MENVFKKRKQPHDETWETHDESGLTSIRATTEMSSASGPSTNAEVSSDIATESNEGACPEESNSLTMDEIDEILESADLSRMHEIDAWIAATNNTDRLSEVCEDIAYAFVDLCDDSDGASIHALIHLPHFHLIASAIIKPTATSLRPSSRFANFENMFVWSIGP